jgi:hypothetical protein
MCLAVKCQFAGDPRIVLVADYLAADDYASYEDVSKYAKVSDQFMTLVSGPELKARDIVRLYQQRMQGVNLGMDDDVVGKLSGPMQEYVQRKNKPDPTHA